MKKIAAALVCAAGLVACNGAPDDQAILRDACEKLFAGDANLTRSIVEDTGQGIDGFCSCYATTTVVDGARTALHKDVLNALNTTMADQGIGVEAAADLIEARIDSGDLDLFDARQFDGVGDDFQEIGETLSDNQGTCPG